MHLVALVAQVVPSEVRLQVERAVLEAQLADSGRRPLAVLEVLEGLEASPPLQREVLAAQLRLVVDLVLLVDLEVPHLLLVDLEVPHLLLVAALELQLLEHLAQPLPTILVDLEVQVVLREALVRPVLLLVVGLDLFLLRVDLVPLPLQVALAPHLLQLAALVQHPPQVALAPHLLLLVDLDQLLLQHRALAGPLAGLAPRRVFSVALELLRRRNLPVPSEVASGRPVLPPSGHRAPPIRCKALASNNSRCSSNSSNKAPPARLPAASRSCSRPMRRTRTRTARCL